MNYRSRPLAFLLLTLSFASHADYLPQEDLKSLVKAAHEKATYNLNQAESAKFKGDRYSAAPSAGKVYFICGEISTKNADGSFSAFDRYYYEVSTGEATRRAEDPAHFDVVWPIFCGVTTPVP